MNVLLDAVSNEGQVLSEINTKLKEVTINIASTSVTGSIKKIAAILGEGMLPSIRVVLDASPRCSHLLANTALDLLDTKVYIPITSDILEAIGVPSISLFGLFSSVNATKSASSWDELVALFGKTADGKTQELKQAPALSHELGKIIHIAGHAVAVNDKDAITKQGRHPYCHVSL
ncbi:hypothetical protein F5B18DRAFT_668613 [Nemania serpens]|nr:hypothetical protein F5B18DRAFT_668613 [Nemania serpens]